MFVLNVFFLTIINILIIFNISVCASIKIALVPGKSKNLYIKELFMSKHFIFSF